MRALGPHNHRAFCLRSANANSTIDKVIYLKCLTASCYRGAIPCSIIDCDLVPIVASMDVRKNAKPRARKEKKKKIARRHREKKKHKPRRNHEMRALPPTLEQALERYREGLLPGGCESALDLVSYQPRQRWCPSGYEFYVAPRSGLGCCRFFSAEEMPALERDLYAELTRARQRQRLSKRQRPAPEPGFGVRQRPLKKSRQRDAW